MYSEEQAYIERVKKGDSASYTFLVNKYKNMAFTVALKIVNNREDAEDIIQESFLRAYQQIHTFENKSKFSTWLYTIVYRAALNKLPKNKTEFLAINDNSYENDIADETSTPPESLTIKETQQYVKGAIQRLPQGEALLITLYYLNENSLKEIEEITGLAMNNIKIRLFRARKKLEQELRFLL
ncbi:RNA polymerase sigma factor [Emticicia sp. BO119]|uniref:RNA polymerase sigma factor n=1 Tax=Emticicia sp. BO119 TaxID=2757768 RepID=UPI0015F05DB3|nr:sigma-70 family RNA polymerase sigma factor [Emticicia sp. BO119]MBA4852314.1 sigma-70 family RNA polymerase sigma factor [Emticicia sp. BO119]